MIKEDVVHIYNRILLSHKERWNTSICDKNGSWEYHAKQSRSDGKSQELYDITHMWDMKLKAKNEQMRQTLIDTDNCMVFTRKTKCGER